MSNRLVTHAERSSAVKRETLEESDIPGRVFLDTCVVNFILDYGEQIHDGAAHAQNTSERDAHDIDALRMLFT